MKVKNRRTGIAGFTLVWLGQIVSVLATNMTVFALTIRVFEKTGSATALGHIQVFFITPYLLITPLAGVMVDRHNRKLMMMVSDLTAGLATLSILLLQSQGRLEVWHLYAAVVLQGLGNAFQWPAYSATISLMVPKEQYGRANGMMSLIDTGPGVLAPPDGRCVAASRRPDRDSRHGYCHIHTGNPDPVFCLHPAAAAHAGGSSNTG